MTSDGSDEGIQPLHARRAGLPLDTTLYEGLPAHLVEPLRSWATHYMYDDDLAHRVGVHLRVVVPEPLFGPYAMNLLDHCDLLDAIDLALQLDRRLHWEIDVVGLDEDPSAGLAPWIPQYAWPSASLRARAVEQLDQLLQDGGSAFKVHWATPARLVHRIDPAVTAAAERATTLATPSTAELFSDAWRQVYGARPDPTTGYRQVVRAVEAAACPLALPDDKSCTLGKVIGHMRDSPRKWQVVLLDKGGDGDTAVLVSMLERLWTGQVSRHAGTPTSREQTQQEAEAAVHLAATLIHWLTSGMVEKR